MKITKDTTDEELNAPVELNLLGLRSKLVRGPLTAEQLAEEANHLAALEGQRTARVQLRNALSFDADAAEVRKHLTNQVLLGANDGWSGRLNDVRRSMFDGLRNEVRELLQDFDKGKVVE